MAYWASRNRWARHSWRSVPCPACAAYRSATHTSGLVWPRKSVNTAAPRLSAIRWWTAVEESSTHCHQFFPSTRAEVSSEATTLLLRTSAAVVSAAAASGVPARASMLAMAPSLTRIPKTSSNRRTSRSKPIAWVTCRWRISATRLGPKGEPGHPCGRRRAEAAAAVRAHPAMTMNAGDHRANRRQLEMIISVEAKLICRGQRVLAVRAAFCNARDDPVRIGGQRPEHPGTALSLVRRAALGPAGLASLRWRHRGVVRGLGWPTQFRLELGNPTGQFLDLCCLGQHPCHQLFFG